MFPLWNVPCVTHSGGISAKEFLLNHLYADGWFHYWAYITSFLTYSSCHLVTSMVFGAFTFGKLVIEYSRGNPSGMILELSDTQRWWWEFWHAFSGNLKGIIRLLEDSNINVYKNTLNESILFNNIQISIFRHETILPNMTVSFSILSEWWTKVRLPYW